MIKLGNYRHFKGNIYKVTAIAKNSETGEKFVVYHLVDAPDDIWVRPLAMWNETVERDGQTFLRFTELD